jgi:ribosome-associated translation inhibitor RaiA
LEELEQSVAKVGEMMEAVEAQRAAVEAKFQEAEQMLQQVTKVKEFLSVDDRLRERIRATVARTAGLRRGLPGNDSGHGE